MNKNNEVLNRIKGGLIVSCQALSNEPLFSSFIMSKMAYAAQLGGACGIRANTPEDITKIKEEVNLPIIGIVKAVYNDCEVFITPTEKEVDALMNSKPDIIAIDATDRPRPNGETLDTFFAKIREKYPDMLFMADCATLADAVHAQEIGFDIAGTTLNGYTENTKEEQIPNFNLMKSMVQTLHIPVIAEGGIWTPEQLKEVMDCGVFAAVIGTAITRPMNITRRFVDAIS
jgi:N-acylglucosamine-6-phosphate 2-epimerase